MRSAPLALSVLLLTSAASAEGPKPLELDAPKTNVSSNPSDDIQPRFNLIRADAENFTARVDITLHLNDSDLAPGSFAGPHVTLPGAMVLRDKAGEFYVTSAPLAKSLGKDGEVISTTVLSCNQSGDTQASSLSWVGTLDENTASALENIVWDKDGYTWAQRKSGMRQAAGWICPLLEGTL